ncbi:oxidoreductase [Mycobacterium sp. URHB0044]|uniref:oxidoreductase n=1 Tax=Mycobacterium sp. URHB0044 TaxID=1380386 RepID=UPI00048F74A0|nr:oxidoreductase [Mycobacterium sp. URHB0044]
MTESTANRVWLITGANSGFGRAIAEAALAAGDTVVAAARRPDTLADLVDAAPDRVTPLRLDITDHDRIAAAVDEVLARHGRVDVLVNNAGRGAIGAAEETSDEELRALMDLHFFGPAALTRALLPQMRERGSGAIVQMSSMGGRFTFPGVGAYSATKFALEGWSEALAKEVGGFDIRVLIVEPGAFRTSFNGPGALLVSTPIAAYDDQIEPLRTGMPEDDGKQPGDPAKAAAAILTALNSEQPPLRLALGNDAVDAVATALEDAKAELAAWEKVGRATVFDG